MNYLLCQDGDPRSGRLRLQQFWQSLKCLHAITFPLSSLLRDTDEIYEQSQPVALSTASKTL